MGILAVAGAAIAVPAPARESLEKRAKRAIAAAKRADRQAAAALDSASQPKLPGEPGADGPAGADGAPGPPGPQGQPGPHGDSMFGQVIPSGLTVRGAWGGRFPRPADGVLRFTVQLPARAPAPIASQDIGFAHGTGDNLGDQCTGSLGEPTAAPGFVCLYRDTSTAAGYAASGMSLATDPLSPANELGFAIDLAVADPNLTMVQAQGTWAYTAP